MLNIEKIRTGLRDIILFSIESKRIVTDDEQKEIDSLDGRILDGEDINEYDAGFLKATLEDQLDIDLKLDSLVSGVYDEFAKDDGEGNKLIVNENEIKETRETTFTTSWRAFLESGTVWMVFRKIYSALYSR